MKKSDRRWFAIPWGLTVLQILAVPKNSFYGIQFAFFWSDENFSGDHAGGIVWEQLGFTLALIWLIFLGYWFIFVKEQK